MSKLQEMRKRRGIRPVELARRLNVSRSCICVAEKKGIRNADAAERYAAALSCRPDELMDFFIPHVNDNINLEKQDAKLA